MEDSNIRSALHVNEVQLRVLSLALVTHHLITTGNRAFRL
jgi:hypothetical protein